MRIGKALSACAITGLQLLQAVNVSAADRQESRTGICVRKLEWVDERNQAQYHLEKVIAVSSGDVIADVKREKIYILDFIKPHLPHWNSFVWIGAWVSDNAVNQVEGPDCSKLPEIREK